MTGKLEMANGIPKNAWRIEPIWDDRADSIGLGYRDRSEEQFDAMDSSIWGEEPLPPECHPVLMGLYKGKWHNRDLTKGRMYGDCMVSAELRALLLECDPGGVHFDPVELAIEDGTVLTDRYWMLKVPRMLDALVPEKSRVKERVSRRTGNFLGWGYMTNSPPTLSRDVVAGHHIWRLQNLMPTEIFVSDWLKVEMDRRDLGPFKAQPAPLD
ncbi:DUF1629 domain-containing protein [Jannaschia sp.]|nr:DUF1629 domain-containing protein [Jannaschia sp.]